MAKCSRLFLTLGMMFLLSFHALGQETKKSDEIILQGEIVDTKCYLEGSMGSGSGLDHRECAKSGVPLALVEEKTGTVYFLGRQTKPASLNEMLLPFISDRVSITGKIVQRGGAKMIMIDMVERLGEFDIHNAVTQKKTPPKQ